VRSPPCLTLLQPWASLIFDGPKVHETRSWPAPDKIIGQQLVIHAGARHVPLYDLPPLLVDLVRFLWRYRTEGPFYGGALGTVRLVSCTRTETTVPASREDEIAGNWASGRWAWRFEEPRAFAVPRVMKGAQGIWYCDRPELLQESP
jgi:hypothetical protein